MGRPRLAQILADLGAEETQLLDQTAWVSLRFCEAFFQKLAEATSDPTTLPTLFERCGRMAVSSKYAGILRPLFRAFGSPLFAFRQVVQATGRFNKIGEMVLRQAHAGLVEIEYRPRPGAPVERSEHICQARAAQLGALPTMFDLAPGQVHHEVCLQRGGDVCLYRITWKEYGGRFKWRWAFLAAVLATSAGGYALAAWPGWLIAGASLVAGAITAIVVQAVELRRTAARQAVDLVESHGALARSARFHELRFAELTEAKAGVERKVEERTSELRDVNQRLEEALREVRTLEESERTFFANVSHDLRTPLTLILAPLEELVRNTELPVAIERDLQTVRRNAQHLRRLIDQLLELEKLQAGRIQLAPVPLDLRSLVTAVAEKVSHRDFRRGLALEVSNPPEGQIVAADVTWIDSALTNLISNALKFARTKIKLEVTGEGDAVVLVVEDDGPGIPEEERARIFDRFAQAGSPQERRRGTGLGLPIAREAARLHGGSLSLSSRTPAGAEAEGGTRFILSLPRVHPSEPLDPNAIPAGGDNRGGADDEAPDRSIKRWPGPSPDSPLVLVIEDDDELRSYMANCLCTKYRVDAAIDGEDGLRLLRAHRPDAVVCDVGMPVKDGYAVCREIRADAELYMTPILLVTARRHVDRIVEGFEAGANDYLMKPFHVKELTARLEAHLLVRHLLRATAHKERLAALGLLAAGVAHQVRNPLSALKNTVRAIEKKVSAESMVVSPDMFGLVAECVARIEKFTRDLLDLSRVDDAQVGRFRPADGIESVVRLMSTRLSAQVQVSCDLDRNVQLVGRAGDMNHVFMNLIDNALRAVGSRGTVDIRAGRGAETFFFEIEDSGPGIPVDRRQWIFEPFATTRSSDGTGLGLFLVRQIVFDHGGTVAVDSGQSGGALFRVSIPCAPDETMIAVRNRAIRLG